MPRKALPDVEDLAPLDPAEIEALRKRVSRARTALNDWVPFFGYLCLKLAPYFDDSVPTAGVAEDGTLVLNPFFAASLTDAELCGLICHETMHPALLCWERRQDRNAVALTRVGTAPDGRPILRATSVWNVAQDHVINLAIRRMAETLHLAGRVDLPDGGCLDPRYEGWSSEEVYDDLVERMTPSPSGEFWVEGDDWAWANSDGDGLEVLPGDGTPLAGDIDAEPRSAKGREAHAGSRSAKRELGDGWKVDVVAAARLHERRKGKGSLPASLRRLVDGITEPRLCWKEVLSQWLGEHGRRGDYTYHRPSRRSAAVGQYLPSLQKTGSDDVAVLWDTSASLFGREVEILGEIEAICDDLGIGLRVVACDAAVHADVPDVRSAEEASLCAIGGGGSDFRPAFEHLESEGFPGVVVAFTDGRIDVPGVKPPTIREVLWVLFGLGRSRDPTQGRWGQCLWIDAGGNGRLGSGP